jgi:hypothetical protein
MCAGDPWAAQIMGERPRMSSAMSLDGMRRTRTYGSYFVTRDHVEMDHLGDLDAVRSQAAEVYEWQGPPITRYSSSSKFETARVVVLRNTFGDPRALRGEHGDRYGSPVTLPTGVMDFPPTRANIDESFAPTGGTEIFTFGDGTWVRVDGWMAQRFRAAFSTVGAPPPRPPAGPSAAWEVCATFDQQKALASGAWGATPMRGVLRFLTTSSPNDVDLEMVYRFATPDLAQRAQAEYHQRCAQPTDYGQNDKGIFSLVPPCTNVASITADGPMLRFAIR